jgi:type I restriction enzyme S subunit
MFVNWVSSQVAGAKMPRVSMKVFWEHEIPLPPLAEQKRIAAILDKAEAILRKRQQAIKLADDFLRATFLDMFGDPVTNPKGWPIKKIEELSLRVTKGESPKWQGFNYQETGVSFVTSENVLWGSLDKNKRKYIPEKFHKKLKRSQLKENDLLVNLVGASVGRACLVPLEALPANINQAVSVTTLDTQQVAPQFVLQQILTPQVQKRLVGNAVDFARANISLTNIRELEIMLPPLNEQKKWMALISRFYSMVSNQNNSMDNCRVLFNSLTQRAFRGEL